MTDVIQENRQESSPTCMVCGRQQQTYDACEKCLLNVRTMLEDLPTLVRECGEALTPGKGGNGSSGSEMSIGVNVAALSWLEGSDVLGVLWEWERLIREERDLTPPGLLNPHGTKHDEIEQSVKFHVAHLEWIGQQPWVDEYARELRGLHRAGVAAARRDIDRARKIPCPADTQEGLPCGTRLTLPDDLLAYFTCPKCKNQWQAVRLVAVALADEQVTVWLDSAAIAGYLGITERKVRDLAKKLGNGPEVRRGQLYAMQAILRANRERLAA